jgi:hypothetical protein
MCHSFYDLVFLNERVESIYLWSSTKVIQHHFSISTMKSNVLSFISNSTIFNPSQLNIFLNALYQVDSSCERSKVDAYSLESGVIANR